MKSRVASRSIVSASLLVRHVVRLQFTCRLLVCCMAAFENTTCDVTHAASVVSRFLRGAGGPVLCRRAAKTCWEAMLAKVYGATYSLVVVRGYFPKGF